MQKLGEEVRKLFFIGTVVATIASAVLVGLRIYDSWAGIQERQASHQQHTGK
ncbi:hypothetical protein [Endozoicomonas atrinae]|uniref:hypothetical protein n=1 Tax=Endozoicomonas atrinae TaxID=1333660 RepID=UPI0015866A40|nr:hypothetical protein [Endozoicomonas atrinae]